MTFTLETKSFAEMNSNQIRRIDALVALGFNPGQNEKNSILPLAQYIY